MSLGRCPEHEDLYRSTRSACEARLGQSSVFRLLEREAPRLFPDEAFADLFADVGRRSVPPRIVAVVMVLQRLHPSLRDGFGVPTRFARHPCTA